MRAFLMARPIFSAAISFVHIKLSIQFFFYKLPIGYFTLWVEFYRDLSGFNIFYCPGKIRRFIHGVSKVCTRAIVSVLPQGDFLLYSSTIRGAHNSFRGAEIYASGNSRVTEIGIHLLIKMCLGTIFCQLFPYYHASWHLMK